MESKSRTKNVILNIIVGIFSQLAIMILSFIGRTVFVHFLDSEYLGINGLYNNILSVLALAELGLGNVTQFYLYKPVAEDDTTMITSLVKLFQKMYLVISLVILGIGILIIPLLKYIVNSNLSQKELVVYYILFLMNSVVSYFAAHKIALLAAYQDTRLQKYTMLATNFATQILHIAVLTIWQSYVLYVFVTVFATFVNVVLINLLSNKKYPYLKTTQICKIPKKYKTGIINKIKATFAYKIGATIVNNTDNILISVMISTVAVGLYSNYYMIIAAVQGFIAIITTALIPGIGNLSTSGNKKRMYIVFNTMLLFYQMIAIWGAASFYFLFNEFIPIWLGEGYVLDKFTVFAIAFGFYLTNAISPIWMFREANGLFDKVKYLLLNTAIANIVFSVILGKIWGMAGILIATSVARIITQVWYEPHILFKNVFQLSSKYYWKKQLWYLFLAGLTFTICYLLSGILPCGFEGIILKGISFVVITIIIFSIGNIKTTEFKEICAFAKRIIKR